MNKENFILELKKSLSELPEKEVDERIAFYTEMLDDRIEEGLSEDEAVADIGTVEEIADEIITHIPLSKIVKERIRPKRRLTALEITLIIVFSPIWIALLASALAVIISLVASVAALIISLLSVSVSMPIMGTWGIFSGIFKIFTENPSSAFPIIFASFIILGLSVFLFFGCKITIKYTLLFTKRLVLGIKRKLSKRRYN